MTKTAPPQPIPPHYLIRFLLLVIVILALAAGYYQSVLDVYKNRYQRLELKYIKSQADLDKMTTNP